MRLGKVILVVVVVAVGIASFFLYAAWDDATGSRRPNQKLENVAPGISWQSVRAALGPPDAICRGGSHPVPHLLPLHLWTRQRELRRELSHATEERWIYSASGREGLPGCRPSYNDVEIGFGVQGKVIWIMPAVGESTLNVASEFEE